MARKIIVSGGDADKFGIFVSYPGGGGGWLAGEDNGYMLFETQKSAEKALRDLKRANHYSWNCEASVRQFE